MNEIKPNEPFNANKEQEEYGKYQKSEGCQGERLKFRVT